MSAKRNADRSTGATESTSARESQSRSEKGQKSWPHRLQALVAGLIGLALLIGVPYALVRFVGNPFSALPTSFAQVSDYVSSRFIPSEVIAGLLAIVLWLLWAQYVWALVWELAVVGPAAAKGQLSRAAPLAPGIIRSIASAVVSGLLTASVVASSSSLASIGAHAIATPAALATDSQPTINEAVRAGVEPAALDGRDVYVVGQRESLWSISGQDDAMVKRLLEINEDQIRSPIDVRPGMELIVPVGLLPDRPTDSATGVGESETGGDRSEFDTGDQHGADSNGAGRTNGNTSHVVVEGDNLWNLSEARLQAENGADPSNQEIAEQVAEVVERNQAVIEDPDLIYPGEVLAIPSDQAGPQTAPPPPQPPAEESSAQETVDDSEAMQQIPAVQPTSNADDTQQLDAAEITAEQSTEPPPGEAGDEADGPQNEVTITSTVTLAALAGGVTASSALLGVLVALRRKRAGSLGFTAARRLENDASGDRLIRDLAGGSDHEFTVWVASQLHELLALLPATSGVSPVGVRLALNSWLSAQSGMTVIWDAPMPHLIGAWEPREEQEWFLAYDDTSTDAAANALSVAAGHKPGAIPGLVTLGELTDETQDGQELLVDLEAYGSIALGGSVDQIEAAARAIAYEAGAGESLSNFRVTTVDFSFDGLAPLERVSARSQEVALVHAETIVEQYQERSIDDDGNPASAGERDVELFILRTVGANTDRWLEIATARSGIVVLLIGDMRSSRLGARLAIGDDGVGTLSPLNVELRVSGVVPDTAVRLGALFDELTDVPSPRTPAGADLADLAKVGSGVDASPAVVVDEWTQSDLKLPSDLAALAVDHTSLSRAATAPVASGLVIKVLGECRCEELPELVSRALSLVAFLAVQPDRSATRETIADAVWGGRRVSDGQFSKVVAAARSHLGPTRLPKQLSADGLYRLEQVETDFHQFQRLAVQAEHMGVDEAAPLLKSAMALVAGPPFGGVAVDWAAGHRFNDYCCELIEATTVRAIEVLYEVGDHAGLHEVAKTGLRALPVNEPIYRAYMRVAAARGQVEFVQSMYDHLCQKLSLLYPTEHCLPAQETRDLLTRLTEHDPVELG